MIAAAYPFDKRFNIYTTDSLFIRGIFFLF